MKRQSLYQLRRTAQMSCAPPACPISAFTTSVTPEYTQLAWRASEALMAALHDFQIMPIKLSIIQC
jgi:hypothetical protein